MVSGNRDSNTEMVCGRALQEIHTLENGLTRKRTDTGFTFGEMEIDTRVNGKFASSMEMGLTYSQTETLI
jgi:hypothetical protein